MSEWISVKDRSPEDDGVYITSTPIYDDFCRISVERFGRVGRKKTFYNYNRETDERIELDDITHWMPLPKPPGKETPRL